MSAAGDPAALAAAPARDDAAGRGWAAFRRTHLFDYNDAATRVWVALAAAGACALLGALGALIAGPLPELAQVLAWLAVVGVAAAFPIEIPRSRLSMGGADLMIFLLLALFGVPAAVAAAALEGIVSCARGTARVSSRIATPAANAFAMGLAGFAFLLARGALAPHVGAPAAEMVGLALAALVYFPVQTMPLMQVVALKRGTPLALADWYAQSSWIGAVFLVSAMLAGLLSLNAQRYGHWVLAGVVGITGIALAMLRAHFGHQRREHEAQEARVASAEREAEQNQRRFHSAFTHASIGMAIVSPQGSILQTNDALCALLGQGAHALAGLDFRRLLPAGDAALLERHTSALLARRVESFSIELRVLGPAQAETWVSLHCAPFDDQAGAGAGLILQLYDISSRRRAEGELHHIAYHDGLTDLANRTCFVERLHVAVQARQHDPAADFAVMFLDLDRFKIVNDSLGHPAGDSLLKEAGRRLQSCLDNRDLVARLGGDEFALLIERPLGDADAIALGQRLLDALGAPLRINGTEMRPQASIGITFGRRGMREPDDLLRDADLAMYRAKADGKGRVALFDASMRSDTEQKLQLESDLRRAIGEGQLSLAFQPLYDLEPHRLGGFEALARWTHPARGAIGPDVFIALAEETGCIEALTAWAIDEAVRQLAAWRRDLPADDQAVMHVNVSGKDLARPHFVPHVREVLERHALPGRLLVLEITESTLMEHRERALRALAELRELGVRVGIDDFGTGYSSLAYLSTLPFDCLKIDRSFVIGMEQSPQNLEIVRTVVSLARSLNKDVVAEGIETPAQLRRLRQLGVDIGQGYLLGRPLKPEQAMELMQVREAAQV